MKNIVVGLLGLLTLSAVPCRAAEESNGGFFVNANVGRSDVNEVTYNDNDTGYGANLGYRWTFNPYMAIGVEGGYTRIGSFAPIKPFEFPNLRNADIRGWNAGLNGHFNVLPNWYISARGGWFHGDVSADYIVGFSVSSERVDGTSDKYYAGAGFGYDFNSNVSVGLNYDYYKVEKEPLTFSPKLVSVSGEYRF
jgi:opacity protein-like surface antigen